MAAGTLFGIGLSQQNDANGVPMAGCLLYLYLANTLTPVTAYRNTGLTPGQELPNPIVADANGRIPAFWLDAAFSYHALLRNAAGIVQFDEQNILPIGAVSGGGGGGDTTDPNSISSTGDVKWRPNSGTLAGWVRINGRTIGSATSGAAERANADCQTLFEYIWNNFTDAFCPVSTGRGANSLADWNANKTITLLDMRGKSPFGLDDMGAAAAGAFTGVTFAQGDAITRAAKGGASMQTIARANLPNVAPTFTGTPTGALPTTHPSLMRGDIVGGGALQIGSGTTSASIGPNTITVNSFTPAGNVQSLNGGVAQTQIENMSPFMLGTWYWRL